MAKAQPTVNAFNGGEVDPRTQARVDLEVYPRTADIMENVFTSLKGGMAKAPGTIYVDDCPASDVVLLRPFYYGTVKYALELSNTLMRFVLGEGLVQVPGAPATVGTFTDNSAAPGGGGGDPPDGGSGSAMTAVASPGTVTGRILAGPATCFVTGGSGSVSYAWFSGGGFNTTATTPFANSTRFSSGDEGEASDWYCGVTDLVTGEYVVTNPVSVILG